MEKQLSDTACSINPSGTSDLSRRKFALWALGFAVAAACEAEPLSTVPADVSTSDCRPSTHCEPCKDPAPVLKNCFSLTEDDITLSPVPAR